MEKGKNGWLVFSVSMPLSESCFTTFVFIGIIQVFYSVEMFGMKCRYRRVFYLVRICDSYSFFERRICGELLIARTNGYI